MKSFHENLLIEANSGSSNDQNFRIYLELNQENIILRLLPYKNHIVLNENTRRTHLLTKCKNFN